MTAPTRGFAYGPLVGVLARRVENPANFGAFVSEQTKRELLAQVFARFGRDGLVEVGREVAAESAHPFVRVLLAQPSPSLLLSAWMQVEVLAHTHNRVPILDIKDCSLQLLRLRLVADEHPRVEEDLFILRRAGRLHCRARVWKIHAERSCRGRAGPRVVAWL